MAKKDLKNMGTEAAKLAERLEKAEQKKKQTARTASASTSAGNGSRYYSPRQYGADTGTLEARVTAAQTAMEERATPLNQSRTNLEKLRSAATEAERNYYATKGKFRGANAAQYEKQMMDTWTTATKAYSEGYIAFQQEYKAYLPYETAYNDAVGAYNSYVTAERDAYANWKNTIRDAESIRAEQQELGKLRRELQQRMQMANSYASGAALAPGQEAQWRENEARIAELQEYLGGVGDREKLLAEELGWSEHFLYEDLRTNQDFAEKSKYQSTYNDNLAAVAGLANASAYGDATYDYINRDRRAQAEVAGMDPLGDMQHLTAMTDDEIAMYNYVYATQGADAANAYITHLTPELTARYTGGVQDATAELAQTGWGAVVGSGLSVLMSPYAAIRSGIGTLGSALTGQGLDPNANYNMATNLKNSIRQNISDEIEKSAGPVGSFAYGTVMSMADMLMDAATGNPTAAMALIGSRSFSESVIDSKNRGLGDAEALALGVASAGAEIITEKLGLDELLKLPEGWEDAGFWKGLLKGAWGEAKEEGLTNVINLAADIAVAGEKSQFAQSIEAYKAEGKDDKAALLAALKDAGISLAVDTLGGAVSGGVFGGYRGAKGKRAAGAAEAKAGTVSEMETVETATDRSDNATEMVDNATEMVDNATDTLAGDVKKSLTTAEETSVVGAESATATETKAGRTIEELKREALNHRNPLLTGRMNTAQQEDELRRIRKAATKTEVTAIDYGVSEEKTQEALRIRELIGKEIIFDPAYQEYYGYYDKASDEIHISADTEDVQAATIGHELTHSIEGTAQWESLRNLVAARMADTGMSWETARRQRRELYDKAGHALVNEWEIDQEVVARYVEEHLLTDEQSIRELVRDDRSIARRILDWLDGLWAKIAKTKGAKEREFVRQARDIYRAALTEAEGRRNQRELRRAAHEAYHAGDDEAGDAAIEDLLGENPEGWLEDGDYDLSDDARIPFSIKRTKNMDWKTQILGHLEHRGSIRRNDTLVVDDAYAFLKEAGVVDVPFAVPLSVVTKAQSGKDASHSIQNGNLVRLQDGMRNAPIVIRNPDRASIVFVTNVKQNGKPVLVAFRENVDFDGDRVHKATSIHLQMDVASMLQALPANATVYARNGNELHAAVGVANNLRSLAANVEFIGDIVTAENGNVKKYSIREDEGGFTKGWHDDDEAARAAQMEGYPVINGVQIVPMKTWVLAQDYAKDKDGNVVTDKKGNPIQHHNYGLVAGLGSKPGTLKVNFHNKSVVNEKTGETLRKDGVEIAIEDLTPKPGVFQQTEEDFNSLVEQMPEETTYYSAEELAELEDMSRRAYQETDEEKRTANWEPVDPVDLTGRAREYLDRGIKRLSKRVAGLMMVPRWARQDFLDPIVEGIVNTYLEKGTVDQALRDELFDKAWEEGRVVEREFYDTYRDVKDYLRTTAMNVPQEIRDAIGDFDDYSKRVFGKLRTSEDGGIEIDAVWAEAQRMAPALFPDDILNEEDRVRHMLDVAGRIVKAEQNLDEFYAEDLKDAKAWSRNDFEVAVQEAIRTAWEVRRIALDQKADAAAVTDAEGEVLTEEEVTALYPKLKDARKAVEKAMARNLLNKQDKNQVQRLLRRDIQPEHLDPDVDNVRAILAVYEAKRAFEDVAGPIREWNRRRKATLYAEAEEIIYAAEVAGGIQDKKRGIQYSRETMERNILDIVKDKASADALIATYFKPVHTAEAAATRMKNQYRERIRKLDISRKVKKGDTVSEAYAVQFVGEVNDILRMMERSRFRLRKRDGKSYNEWQAELKKLWEENPGLDKAKIEGTAAEMGRIYEELFAQMNKVRVHNGYEPINHRSGYFPHFQQDGRDGILAQFGKALGIDVEVQQLPTSINGMTHTFKPGIRWFGNALERKTFDTAYDAVEGFDRYIEGVASVVHQTENIQRLRALANQIRYRTGDEGLREQIRKIQEREDLTDEQKDTLIRETASNGKFALSNFVVELDEYTNLLANKKSRADRNMEQAMGRDMYNIVKGLESRVAANMVAINPGSWLTNFIPITQGWACLSNRHLLSGMGQTLKAMKTDDGMVDMSDFLTNRQGSDALVQTTAQGRLKEWTGNQKGVLKVMGKSIDGSIVEWIDNFTAGTLVRARYAQNMAQGLSQAEAVSEADEWAAGVMADRSKGAMPTLFHRSSPITKLFTQFQLEVNNQVSYIFKDIPRQKRDEGLKALALALLKLALGAWLYNELYEKVLGRRPALDPIDMVFGFGKEVYDFGYAKIHDIEPETDIYDAVANLGGKIAENTPFIGGLLGGGRVPISSALPDMANLGKALLDDDWSAGKKLAAAGKELAKPAVYMLPPFGGGQIKKIWEGLKMIAQGGSYTVDAKGNPLLQYPLQSSNSAVQSALEAGQAMIFGKTTIRSGREWVEGGFKNLSAQQTATYQALLALDVSQADAFALMKEMRAEEKDVDKRQVIRDSGLEGDALSTVYYDLMASDKEAALMEKLMEADADMGAVANVLMDMKDAQKTEDMSQTQVQRQILMDSGLEGDTLSTVYYDLMASDKEKALMDALQDTGADMGMVAKVVVGIKDAATSNDKRTAILSSGLKDSQKQEIYRTLISDSYDERIENFRAAGMDMDDFLVAQNQYTTIKESYEDEGDMATAFARWVNQQSYSSEQKTVIRDSLKYWRQLPADPSKYDRAIEAGMSDADAAELVEELDALEPPEGKDDPTNAQKWRVAIDESVSESNQLMRLKAVGMQDATYAKVEAAYQIGIAPAAYVRAEELKAEFNEDGKGDLKNDEWTKLIDSMCPYGIVLPGDTKRFSLTEEQKGFLWQMLTGSKSTANNPYGKSGGEKWLAVKESMKAE